MRRARRWGGSRRRRRAERGGEASDGVADIAGRAAFRPARLAGLVAVSGFDDRGEGAGGQRRRGRGCRRWRFVVGERIGNSGDGPRRSLWGRRGRRGGGRRRRGGMRRARRWGGSRRRRRAERGGEASDGVADIAGRAAFRPARLAGLVAVSGFDDRGDGAGARRRSGGRRRRIVVGARLQRIGNSGDRARRSRWGRRGRRGGSRRRARRGGRSRDGRWRRQFVAVFSRDHVNDERERVEVAVRVGYAKRLRAVEDGDAGRSGDRRAGR